jgi:hypothetical protein
MTDAEAAIERLTAWVRDYGDSKPQAFVGDVSMLLLIAKESQAKIESMKSALLSIRDSPHCVYKNANEYAIGVADGHRHCANVARAAIDGLTKNPNPEADE